MSLDFGTHLARWAIRKNACPQSVVPQRPRWRNWETRRTQNPQTRFFDTSEITIEIAQNQDRQAFVSILLFEGIPSSSVWFDNNTAQIQHKGVGVPWVSTNPVPLPSLSVYDIFFDFFFTC